MTTAPQVAGGGPDSRTTRNFTFVSYAMSVVRAVYARVNVTFVGETSPPTPAIYVANHRSVFDLPVGFEFFRRLGVAPQVAVHHRYFRSRIATPLLNRVGAVPTGPGFGSVWMQAAESAIAAGGSVAVMPEGRIVARGDSSGVESLFSGAARLAIAAAVPIVPIGVAGTEQVWRPGRMFTLPRWPRKPVTLVVGEAIKPGNLSARDLTDVVRSHLIRLIAEARVEAESVRVR